MNLQKLKIFILLFTGTILRQVDIFSRKSVIKFERNILLFGCI